MDRARAENATKDGQIREMNQEGKRQHTQMADRQAGRQKERKTGGKKDRKGGSAQRLPRR